MKPMPSMKTLLLLVSSALLLTGCQEAPKKPKPRPVTVTVVVYSADWCEPCQRAKPTLRKLRELGHRVQVVDCTYSTPPGVETLPKFVVYNDKGEIVGEAESLSALILIIKALGIILPLFL